MTTTTRESARHVCATPCYIDDNNSAPSNPYRLTVYVDGNGEIMLAAEGNGCADDIALADISGDDADSIRETWGHIDTDALRDNAAELRAAGLDDEADYLLAWASRKDEAEYIA